MGLPRPWQEMTVAIIEDSERQALLVGAALRGERPPANAPDCFYLPGLIYGTTDEEADSGREAVQSSVHAWGRLACECRRAGGWDFAQLQEALGRVDALMAETPNLRTTAANAAAAGARQRAAKGFGQREALA